MDVSTSTVADLLQVLHVEYKYFQSQYAWLRRPCALLRYATENRYGTGDFVLHHY
uniref:Uncharacterized protein n=1 Tax=Schistosoma mansoni TaxID=6183 RepID=A0AA82N7S5_SCHMA